MWIIVVKYKVRPEWMNRWPELVADFTASTRAEPGNIFFEWSRSVEANDEFVLIEGFTDEGMEAHGASDHMRAALERMPRALVRTPVAIRRQVENGGWAEIPALRVSGAPA